MDKFEDRLYRPIIYFLLIVVVVTFTLVPIGLPMKVGDRPRVFLQRLREVPDGAVVWYGIDTGAGGLPELRAAMVAVGQYLFERPVRIVFSAVGSTGEGPIIYNMLLKDFSIPANKKYGVDYVFLGYIAGMETAYAALARDIRSLITNDHFKTPLESMPVMKGVNSARDFALVLIFTSGQDSVEGYIRQWATPYGAPLAMVVLSAMGPPTEPYYPKQVIAMLSSASQGAQFEILINKPGYGVGSMDAQSAVHVMLLGFIVLGNAYTFHRKRKQGAR